MKPVQRFCIATILSLGLAAPVLAECELPKQPSPPPSGAKATQEEMVAAMRASRQFDTDIKAYQACIDTETENMIAALGDKASEDDIKRIKIKQDTKVREAGEASVKVADAVNKEIRAFKAKAK